MIEWRLAWRNIWRHPRRTWLTIAAMVFCNTLLIFLISLQFGTYQMMIDNTLQVFTGHVQIQAPGYLDEPSMRKSVADIAPLSETLREEFPTVAVSARAIGFALASSAERSYGIQVVGVQPESEAKVSTLPGLMVEGRYLSSEDRRSIVIGEVLARNLQVTVGDELTLLGSGRDGSMAADVLTIVGIFSSGVAAIDRSFGQISLTHFQEMFFMADHGHAIVINAPVFEAVPGILTQLQNQFAETDDVVVLDWDSMQPGLKQAIQADKASSWFIYGILVVLVAFSVMNTQLMSVLERTREFGVVMALGFRPGRLSRLVLIETGCMALIGFALGALVGGTLTLVLTYTGFTYPGMEEMAEKFNLSSVMYPELSFVSIMSGPAIIFIGSLCAAVYPALRLHLLQPVAAMRAV